MLLVATKDDQKPIAMFIRHVQPRGNSEQEAKTKKWYAGAMAKAPARG